MYEIYDYIQRKNKQLWSKARGGERCSVCVGGPDVLHALGVRAEGSLASRIESSS